MLASLDRIAQDYNLDPEPGTLAVGGDPAYREVRIEDWPANLHFEFVPREAGYNIELHYQDPVDENVFPLFGAAKVIAEKMFPGLDVRVLHNRTQKVAVRVALPDALEGHLVVDHMRQFVRGTRETVSWACDGRLSFVW